MVQNEVDMYNRVYTEFKEYREACRVSCHQLDKAERKVRGVMRTFGISSLQGAEILDVGCGLGYFSESLRRQGANVTALDNSSVAVDLVREAFPEVEPKFGSFPEDATGEGKYDLIWACDFAGLNHFDVDTMCQEFFRPALKLLSSDGVLVVGWRSNFGGTMGDSHWAHWSLPMIKELKRKTGLTGPRAVPFSGALTSLGLVYLSKSLKRSIPIFFSMNRSASVDDLASRPVHRSKFIVEKSGSLE